MNRPSNHKPGCRCVVCNNVGAANKRTKVGGPRLGDVSIDPELTIEHLDKILAEPPKKSGTLESRQEACVETLPVVLTEAELDRISDRCAALVGEIEDKQAALKSAQQTMGGEIKTLQSQLSSQSKKFRDKQEYREVDCTRIFDYVRIEVRVVRVDTGETIRTRAMNAAERQAELMVDGKSFKATRPSPPVPADDFNDDKDSD